MASTYNSIMQGVETVDAGDLVNTYGVNMAEPNWDNLVKATFGVKSVTLTGDTTVTDTQGATNNESENKAILLGGSLSSAANYTLPSRQRVQLFYNSTGANVTPKTSAGSGFTIPTGYMAWGYSDATDFYSRPLFVNGTVYATAGTANNHLTTLNQVSGLIAAASVSGDGSALVSADDTTRKFLEDAITVSDSGAATVTLSTTSPGGNEKLNIDVAVANPETLALTDGGDKTTTFTAAVNTKYTADFTSSSYTVTLPAAPAKGDIVRITKYGTNVMTLGLNSLNFKGSSTNPTTANEGITTLEYTSAARGWVEQ